MPGRIVNLCVVAAEEALSNALQSNPVILIDSKPEDFAFSAIAFHWMPMVTKSLLN